MSIWEAVTGRYKNLPEVNPGELETLRVLNSPFDFRPIDNKIALDLMNKDLVKLARTERGYMLTGKGRSVLAKKS